MTGLKRKASVSWVGRRKGAERRLGDRAVGLGEERGTVGRLQRPESRQLLGGDRRRAYLEAVEGASCRR